VAVPLRIAQKLFAYFDIPADFIDHVFGNLYARDVLTQRERELCAVAALCVLNRANELKSHIIAAVRAGATKAEVAEVLLQMSTYGGMPVCIEGLETARQVFDKGRRSRKGPNSLGRESLWMPFSTQALSRWSEPTRRIWDTLSS